MKVLTTSIIIILLFIMAHSAYNFIELLNTMPDEHSGKRYDRCMSAFEGTPEQATCKEYIK